MENDTKIQPSRKKPLSATNIVAALLAAHGLFLIILGLIAFFGSFAGVHDVSNGHATRGTMVAVLGAVLAWVFLLGGIVSFLCAQGLLAWQRWAFWLTLALGVIDLLTGWCALTLRLFTPWPIVLNMSIAGGILLYLLAAIDPRTFFRR
jgi:uncharacterized membrane protein (DUF485 family)